MVSNVFPTKRLFREIANSRTGQSRYKMNLHYLVILEKKEEQKQKKAWGRREKVYYEAVEA